MDFAPRDISEEMVDSVGDGLGRQQMLGLGRGHEGDGFEVVKYSVDGLGGKGGLESIVADWCTKDPGAIVDKLHFRGKASVYEEGFGEVLGRGEDAAFVAAKFTLEDAAVEVGPALVG